jgi:hypothetical protein
MRWRIGLRFTSRQFLPYFLSHLADLGRSLLSVVKLFIRSSIFANRIQSLRNF